MLLILAGCDCDHDVHPRIAVGNLLCADGSIIPADHVAESGSQPVAVVFYVNNDEETPGRGYAVWLRDIAPAALADSLGPVQGTSVDLADFSGNDNTYAMYVCDETGSPLAQEVFKMWTHGQSAYIPSVGQMRLLFRARDVINPIIKATGGEVIPVDDRFCWYWTSTEVAGQAGYKAWLYSLGAGVAQETPKDEVHKARPIITIID